MKTPPWTAQGKKEKMQSGPHKSAQDHLEFLHTEFHDMIQQGYWVILPYATVQNWPHIRLSPLGVVPQRERCLRTIVDYTFHHVNRETHKLAPAEAMQFGHALQRILQCLVDAEPRYRPPQFIKIDIADGFYQLWLATHDIPKVGVVLLPTPDMLSCVLSVCDRGTYPDCVCSATWMSLCSGSMNQRVV